MNDISKICASTSARESIAKMQWRIFKGKIKTLDEMRAYYILGFCIPWFVMFATTIAGCTKESGVYTAGDIAKRYSLFAILTGVIIGFNWRVGILFMGWIVVTALYCLNFLPGLSAQYPGWDPLGMVTCIFRHSTWNHILGNTALFIYPLIILTGIIRLKGTDIALVVFSAWLFDVLLVSIFGITGRGYTGSSGINWGVISCAWLLCLVNYKKRWNWLLPMSLIFFYSLPGTMKWFVDSETGWIAHLGGCFGGFLAAMIIIRKNEYAL